MVRLFVYSKKQKMLRFCGVLLWFLVAPGLAQDCEWDQSTDPDQGLDPISLENGAHVLVSEPGDAISCRAACCQDQNCDLAQVLLGQDGERRCVLVSCAGAQCVLRRDAQSLLFRKQRGEAQEKAPSPGDALRVQPLLGLWEPRGNDTNSTRCLQPVRTGSCRAAFPRFFYNASSGSCSSFIYGGCDGNDNNFESQSECEDACSRVPVSGRALQEDQASAAHQSGVKAPRMAPVPLRSADPQRIESCGSKPEVGPCRAAMQRWYYNEETGSCQMFLYGGCKGNENNFLSEETCKAACTAVTALPSSKKESEEDEGHRDAKDHCNLKPDPGPCRAAFPKFYYDRDSFSCKSFIYGGCRGNANQFDTPEACMASCSGDGVFHGHSKAHSRWTAAFFLFATLAAISALLLVTVIIITLRRHRLVRSSSFISDKEELLPDLDEMSSVESLSVPESPKPEQKA
uniref:BPTI/Kunitz inhibitor domain-containing protein n=1 Tax=Oryzias latipes TaxID=8090 RepID=A0A3P9H6C1_ORYLA